MIPTYLPLGVRDLWILAECDGRTTDEVCVRMTTGQFLELIGMREGEVCVALERLRAAGCLGIEYRAREIPRWYVTEWGRQVLSMTCDACLRAKECDDVKR